MKLAELLLKISKYLPKKLQGKLAKWLLRRKIERIFPVATPTKELPEYLKNLENAHKDREKLWGINKPM